MKNFWGTSKILETYANMSRKVRCRHHLDLRWKRIDESEDEHPAQAINEH